MATRVGVDIENYEAEEIEQAEVIETEEPIFELESVETDESTENEFYGSINFGDEDE